MRRTSEDRPWSIRQNPDGALLWLRQVFPRALLDRSCCLGAGVGGYFAEYLCRPRRTGRRAASFSVLTGDASMADDKHSSIQRRAYEIWEREGRPHGAHERHWREAEKEVGTAPAAKAKPAKSKAAAPTAKAAKAVKAAKPAKPKTTAARKS